MGHIAVRAARRAVVRYRLRGDRLLGPLLLAPSIVYIAALVGLPLLLAIYLTVQRYLRHGIFPSRQELIKTITRAIAEYNVDAKPFAWTYKGDPFRVM